MTRIVPSLPRRLRRRDGISLIELLIVLAMITILTGMAASKLDWVRYRADSVGRSVLSAIAQAQRTAVSLQADVRVTALDGARLRIHEDADNNSVVNVGERVTYLQLEHEFKLGQGSMADVPAPADPAELTTVTFRRDGTASTGGTFYLSSSMPDPDCKYCRAVAITRTTGRTVWYSLATGAWKRGN